MGATILSFLYAFMPNTRNGGGGGDREVSGGDFGAVFGEHITAQQYQNAKQEARILYRLNRQEWPTEEQRKALMQYTDQQLLLNAELDQYHITVTPEAAARYTKMFLGIRPDDPVPPERIMDALAKLAHDGNVSLADIDRFARHQAGQEYLIALVGMSGELITPQEAEVFFRKENEPMQTELVRFSATNYYSQTTPTQQDIEDFYTKRQADYRLADRIVVNYIAFSASNYTNKVEKELGTNLNDHVEQEYYQQGAAAFKDTNGAPMSASEAKAKIKSQILLYTALSEAKTDAYKFLNDLSQGHDDDHPYTQGDLATLAKAKGLTVKTTEPFDQKNGPKGMELAPRDLHMLFELRTDDPDDKEHASMYAQSPIEGMEGAYVMGLVQRIPSEAQPLSAVREQVIADYRESKAVDLAKTAGSHFEQDLQAGLGQGKTFETMCAARFIHPEKLSPFSLVTTSLPDISDKSLFAQVQEVAGRMHPGQTSPFIPTDDGGFILYYKAALPVDESLVKQELPNFLARMREKLQIAAFNSWFNRQYQLHFVPSAEENAGS